ncbi:DUF4179 domain-containing protein [Lederbergia citrea]|uniref:DUF4179 domain-containing protein n=1 Tax=Lederbergia citrea TaxID=2833581 RepID=UPI001BC951E8|nr:DUF4179 domain-containing protein [Lederbergia citrea]MBS4205330.1 DUF4179 domain-containing protein [Lederbergia citrea]
MNNIEKRLADEKKRMDSITAPDELEMRLRNALNTTPPRRAKRIGAIWKVAVVALLFMTIFGYQYNAVAYYSKKLFGFDEVTNGTLKELNDKGMGQIIEKKTKLKDGTEFIINGLMADANQLIMYYTLHNPKGIDDQTVDPFLSSKITGFLTKSNMESGTYIFNDDKTEIKGTTAFEPVSPFSKKLTLHYNDIDTREEINFPYDPNKAMHTQIKQSINKTLKVDKGEVTFHSITATPTLTVINGLLQVDNFDRVHFAQEGIELIANGTPIPLIGGGSQSSLRGIKFDIRYDTLPEKLDSLELVMKKFVGYETLKEKISLAAMDKPISLHGKDLWVKNVAKTSEGIEITIATDDDVMLDGVSIETQGEIIPLKTTVRQHETEQENGRMLKERTLLFDTKKEPQYLLIEGMHYMKTYNHVIEIPVK